MLHALWLPEITIRQGQGIPGVSVFVSDRECENSVTASAGDREQGIGYAAARKVIEEGYR